MGLFDRSENSNQRSLRPNRIILAIMIAVIGFIMYLSNTEENPITGEKQYVSMSPSEEIRIGLQAAPKMSSEMGGELHSSDPKMEEVNKIGNEILQKTSANKGPWKFQFHVLNDSKTVNAFALPGGQIFITLGLLNLLETESQLAGVLSHEMGHVIQRHAAQQMAKSQLGQTLVVAAQTGVESDHSYQAAMIASVVNQMMQLRYSRNDELEADQWGLKLMIDSGYNPYAMLEVMKILEKSGGSGHGPEMLLTHPYPENRMSYIKDYLSKNPPKEKLKEGENLKTKFRNFNQ